MNKRKNRCNFWVLRVETAENLVKMILAENLMLKLSAQNIAKLIEAAPTLSGFNFTR